jgi:uncharacterized membrane protein YidH (DUF202 family)
MEPSATPGGLPVAGAQQERTALAWDRTGLAMTVAGALYLKAAAPPLTGLRQAPGWVAVVSGALLYATAYARSERLRRLLRRRGPAAAPWLLRAIGAVTVGFCCSSFLLILLGG